MLDAETYLADKLENYMEVDSSEVSGHCPFCSDYKNRFFFNIDKGVGVCHNCEESKNLAALVSYYEQISYGEAVRMIKEGETSLSEDIELTIRIAGERGISHLKKERNVYTELKEPEWPNYAIALGPEVHHRHQDNIHLLRATKYLEGRGVNKHIMLKMGMRVILWDKMLGRIAIPTTRQGATYAWLFRDATGKAEKKELRTRGSQLKRLLYNLDNVVGKPKCVVTEGVFDAHAVGHLGVAAFGKTLSEDQIMLLEEADFDEVVFCFDSDAHKAIIKTAKKLEQRSTFKAKIKVCFLNDEEGDPGGMDRERLTARIEAASNWDNLQWVRDHLKASKPRRT